MESENEDPGPTGGRWKTEPEDGDEAELEHECAPPEQWPKALACHECGRILDPGSLRSVKLLGFTGAASLSRHVRAFLDTGEPELVKQNVNLDGTGLGL